MAKNEKENVDRIWEVVEKARVCMMATQFSDGLRVRPMEALPERDENVICFITDRRGFAGAPDRSLSGGLSHVRLSQ